MYLTQEIIYLLQFLCSRTAVDDVVQRAMSFPIDDINWSEVYSLFSIHSILPLTSCFLKLIPEKYTDIKIEWEKSVHSNIYYYFNLEKNQNQVLDAFYTAGIPVAVLKGTSAAQYYPTPQLRTMGDIDLLVKPEDYERAVSCLTELGCLETTTQEEKRIGRHRTFRFVNSLIELHHYFSLGVDAKKATVLDDALFSAISSERTMLPDDENGLVLLSHIRQHLQDGLGLRQIVDWMMFVQFYLDDQNWFSSFQKMTQETGLEQLAVAVTKMCQQYLGLTEKNRTWCSRADERVCSQLLQYVLDCGNFGQNRKFHESGIASRMPSYNHPIKLFKYLQKHGNDNWKMINKAPWLKPFAWAYQLCRSLKMAVNNKMGIKKFRIMFETGRKRNELFSALGLK